MLSNAAAPARPRVGAPVRDAAVAAALTMALSLPQGLLALPIAVAQSGTGRGLLILLVVGALNTATAAWTARHTADAFARRGEVPSLTALAGERLGAGGRLLAMAGGAALFFLALLASVVGLARSLGEMTQAPAWLWGAGCGLALLGGTGGRGALSTRLVTWLGLLNLGLLATLLLLLLPHARPAAAPAPAGDGPLVAIGVSLMLFFAPMLTAPVARQVLPRGGDPRALVWGSASGVALGAALFALWAVVVGRAVGPQALAAASGTAIPLVLAAVPEGRAPALLLGLLLLGMTALRCALVLKAMADEQLPPRLRRGRPLLALAPAGLAVLLALALLLAEAGSFTGLIAIAGAGAASVVSLVVPALLARAQPG
ncbi:MAG TPA: hypothetical protein PKD53_15720 [Chloroflexaceae bacterium]|nr:hypothetical protein [Chloroflexaceae bacterium]